MILPTSAYSDGLLRQLPSEGSWATYRMSEKWDDGTKREIDVTIKSLGSEAAEGLPCSWFEIVMQLPDKSMRKAYRFLTPNEHVLSDPLGKALQVWVRQNEAAPFRDEAWDQFLPRLMLIAPARFENETKHDETKAVTYAGNRLECQVVSGTSTKQVTGSKTIAKYRVLLSDDMPFGVAAVTIDATVVTNCDPDPQAECNFTKGTVEFVATSTGQNAKSVVLVADATSGAPSDAPADR